MNPQALFDALVQELFGLKPLAVPVASGMAGHAIMAEFRNIRDTMSPRVWRAEVLDLAADYGLDTSNVQAAWEAMCRKEQYA